MSILPAAPPTTAMQGFDAEFCDLETYIRVITARIWEGRRIDDIYRYYSNPCVVETPSSVTTDIEDVVRGTRATLAAFPDRRLLAEDIIQSGDAAGGFLSSHRIISTMTHLGDGAFGAPTGKKIAVRTIADCVCRDNRIIHEWLVRDQSAIAKQIGLAPAELARRWLLASQVKDENSKVQSGRAVWDKNAANAVPDGYFSFLSVDADAQRYANSIADFSRAKDAASVYDEAVHQCAPGGTTYNGIDDASGYWQRLFACFQVTNFTIEHLALQQDDGRAKRIALRWRAMAVHCGTGEFGAPTGKIVEIMGINHVEVWRNLIIREWVLIDEIALWMQVIADERAV